MKKLLIFFLLLTVARACSGQLNRPPLSRSPAPANTTSVKFALRLDPATISGWNVLRANNMLGNPTINNAVTDATTSVTLTSIGNNWTPAFGAYYGSNSDGANTGTFDPLFPAAVVAGTHLNSTAFSGSNYLYQVTGLPAGVTITVYLLPSQRSAVDPTVGNINLDVKFGAGSNQNQPAYVKDNTNIYYTFTGTLSSGETLYINMSPAASGGQTFAQLNGIHIKY
jgi:hypothetical protein